MSSGKKLLVATDNDFDLPDPPTHAMIVARKRGGVSYSDADIQGKRFVYHSLYAGASNVWEYWYGSLNAASFPLGWCNCNPGQRDQSLRVRLAPRWAIRPL